MGYRYAWYDGGEGPGSVRLAEAAYQLKLETTGLQKGESAHARRLLGAAYGRHAGDGAQSRRVAESPRRRQGQDA